MARKIKPGILFFYAVMILLSGFNAAINTIILKIIIDSITKGSDIENVVAVLLGFIAYYCLQLIYSTWFKRIYVPRALSTIKCDMNKIIFDKIACIDVQKFEETEFYNQYSRAIDEAETRIVSILDCMYNLSTNIIGVISIIAVMVTMDVWMILISILSILLSVVFSSAIVPIEFEANQERIPYYRKIGYIKKIFSSQQYCKELRIYFMKDYLERKIDIEKEKLDINLKKTGKKTAILEFGAEFATFITDPIIMLYLAVRIMLGALVIGDFTALIMASSNFRNMASAILNYIPRFNENKAYFENLMDFLETKSLIENSEKGTIVDGIDKIEVRNGSFAYLNGKVAIKDISLSINKGEKIAIVGVNGAGKTSFAKLLLRLYDFNSGEIFINGEEYKITDIASLREKFGMVFQDFQLYAFTIAENVLMRDVETVEDEKNVFKALELVGLKKKIEALPKGIYSSLTQEFDENGVMLSGGELQKLAIARAIARNSEILIMDEPSSAMDPLSESEFYKMIFENFNDKTIIMISHHLSYTKRFDKILYFDSGNIVEFGDFNSLINQNGKFAKLYNAQLEKYSCT